LVKSRQSARKKKEGFQTATPQGNQGGGRTDSTVNERKTEKKEGRKKTNGKRGASEKKKQQLANKQPQYLRMKPGDKPPWFKFSHRNATDKKKRGGCKNANQVGEEVPRKPKGSSTKKKVFQRKSRTACHAPEGGNKREKRKRERESKGH